MANLKVVTGGNGSARAGEDTKEGKILATVENYFPHLPRYSDPKTGILSRLPRSWIPYAQLMRIDRPAGLYAFYFPYLIGTAYVVSIAKPIPPPAEVIRFAVVLLPFMFVLRGIVCAWNDNVDQEFDRKVRRCRHRPIARGAVTTMQGHIFTLVLAMLGLPPLLSLSRQCIVHMMITVALFLAYALAKRVTFYPQVFLGFPFAWAIFFCMAAFGTDPFERGARIVSTLTLFTSNVIWTVIYDTIYAHQDIEDDSSAGVKSMALRFRHSTKALAACLLVIQVLLLAVCGFEAGFGRVYFIGTVGGVAVTMMSYIYSVDLRDPGSCGAWFHTQFWTVGAGYLTGLVAEYLGRLDAELLT